MKILLKKNTSENIIEEISNESKEKYFVNNISNKSDEMYCNILNNDIKNKKFRDMEILGTDFSDIIDEPSFKPLDQKNNMFIHDPKNDPENIVNDNFNKITNKNEILDKKTINIIDKQIINKNKEMLTKINTKLENEMLIK